MFEYIVILVFLAMAGIVGAAITRHNIMNDFEAALTDMREFASREANRADQLQMELSIARHQHNNLESTIAALEAKAAAEAEVVSELIGHQLDAPLPPVDYDPETGVILPDNWELSDANSDPVDPAEAAIINPYMEATGAPLCWPVSVDVMRRTCGVNHHIADSWVAHHPECVLSDGRVDLIGILVARMGILFPETFDSSSIASKH